MTSAPVRAPSTRWLPVLAMMVVAPWFAEFSWGGYPVQYLPVAVLFVGPMYGSAVLLIREVAVRSGLGWPTILLLSAAFGVLQCAIVDQSLFNPSYGRFDFQYPAHVGGIDVSAYWLVAFVSGHVVASIAAPLVVVQAWSGHSAEPWLGRRGLWLVTALYVLSTVVNHLGVKAEEGGGFQARPIQVVTAAVVVVLLVVAALLRRRLPPLDRAVPAPRVLGVIGFLAYLLYLPGESSGALVVGLVVIAAAIISVGTWSRSTRWSDLHTFALTMGSVLVGVVMPFLVEPYDDTVSSTERLVAAGLASAVCAVTVATTIRRILSSNRR